MAAHGAETARFAQGVQFIDEYDTGGFELGLHKKIAYARRAQAHKHLHELRTAHAEKGHTALTGHGLGQQSLAGPRGTHQQNAPGHFAADGGEALGRLEKVDHLHQFLLGLLHAGHIVKSDADLVLHVDLGFVFAQGHEPLLLALHALDHEEPDAHEQ